MSERETARQLAAALREVVETFGPWHDVVALRIVDGAQ